MLHATNFILGLKDEVERGGVTDMHFEMFPGQGLSKGEWYWRLKDDDGNQVASCHKSYQSKSECLQNIEVVASIGGAVLVIEVEK